MIEVYSPGAFSEGADGPLDEAENQIRGAHEVAVARLKRIRENIEALREQERQIYLRIKDCEAAGRLFGIEFAPIDRPAKPPSKGSPPNVREFVLSYLSQCPVGAKSSQIAAAYSEEFRRHLHPKTIGMTLYRLKQDGVVRIDGRVWHNQANAGSLR